MVAMARMVEVIELGILSVKLGVSMRAGAPGAPPGPKKRHSSTTIVPFIRGW